MPLLPFPSKNLLLLHPTAITAAGALLTLLSLPTDTAANAAYVGCLCLRMLMVRLGCGQPWCVTLFAAPAAPPAHLLGCSYLLCVCKHCSLVLLLFGLPGGLFIAASCACRSARYTCCCCRCCWGGRGAGRRPEGPLVARDLQRLKQP
jgi:hypothetical protein